MKKWYLTTGILALLLVIGLASCVPATTVSELEDEIARLEGELADTKAELADARAELIGAKTRVLDFGNGLEVFDIRGRRCSVWGQVQNVSDEPMERVEIVAVWYDEEGSICAVGQDTVRDLFIGEAAEWSVGGPYDDKYEAGPPYIYAFGNRSE